MRKQKKTNSLSWQPIAPGDSVGYVAHKLYDSAIDKDRSSVYWIVAIASIFSIISSLYYLNSALLAALILVFCFLGAAEASKKTKETKEKLIESIDSSEADSAEAVVQLSRANVAVMAAIPVPMLRPEHRPTPPKKIQTPTLFPRLAATPWPGRA